MASFDNNNNNETKKSPYHFHETLGTGQDELAKQRATFDQTKIIYVDNLLSEESANKIGNFLQTMPDNWWSSTFFIQQNNDDAPALTDVPYSDAFSHRNIQENKDKCEKCQQMALQTFAQKKFSYSFNRTYEDHYATCHCDLCSFVGFLKTPEFVAKVAELTGYELSRTNEIFASKYISGSFLSPHHDKVKGKIGMTFYLTRNWAPQYGGILHILSSDYKEIVNSFVPKFNHAVFFDIPQQEGIPHFVSHIAPGIPNKRLAVTCWFD